MGKPVSAHKKPLAEEDEDTIREDYVRRMRDSYPLIVRTLMNDIIVSVDKDGNLIFVNDAAVEFLGKSSEELIGANFIEYLHPEDVTKAMSVFQDLVGGKEQVKGFIFRVKSPKEFRTVAMSGIAVLDDKGNYIGAQVVGKDLTDTLRTEEELKWSKKQFRRLFEVIVDPIVIVDTKGNILEVSQSAKNILGLPKEEPVGKNFMETSAVTDESKALMKKSLGQLKKGKSISPHTIKAVTEDGKNLLYEVTPARIMYRGQPAVLAIFRNITEQKKAEEKLQASEERFKHFLDNAPEAIWVQDIVGNFVDGNKKAEELTGYKREELVGKNLLELLVQPESIPKIMEDFEATMFGGLSGPVELEMVKKDGSLVSVEATTIPVKRDGEIEIIGVTRDITERKKQEELLREAGKKFETYFNLAKVMLVAIDTEGNVVEINKKGCEALGYTKEQVLGKNWFSNFLPERLRKDTEAYFRKLLAGQIEPEECRENVVLTKTGKEPLIAWHNLVLKDEQGNIIGTLSSGQDITEQRRAEEKLRASEERFRSLIDNAPEAIWLQDAGGTVVDVNKRAEEMMGYKKDELIGKNMIEANLLPDKSISLVLEAMATIQIGERIEQTELELIRKDGSLVSVETSAFPIETDGKIEVIGIAKDITERKKMEEALKASEERFRGTLDGMLEGCQIIDYNWRYVYVNESAAKHGRLPKKDFLDKTMMELYSGIEATKLFPVLKRCMKERVPAQIETEFTYPNGKKAWFELSIEPVPEGIFVLSIDITDRKEVEEALRREREMLEMVTGNINAGLLIVSKDYTILWANNVLKKYVGDIEGKPCYSVLNQRNDVCHGCGVKEVFETGQDWVVHEQVVPTPDGQEIWLLITATAIRDEMGEIVAASEMSWDITERKKTELALKESEEKFRTIFEGASDGIAAIDPATMKVVFANPALVKILGFSMDKVIGSTILDYIPKEEIAATMEKFQNGVSGKRDVFRDLPVLRQDNTRIYIDVTSKFLTFGNQRYLISFVRDVTEEKKAHEALRESEEKYREMINAMNDIAIVIDFDLNIIDANTTAVKVSGYSMKELLSMKINEIDALLTEEHIKGLAKKMKAREIIVFETLHTTKDGKTFPVEVSSSHVTHQGKPAILSIARDITERKRAEKELIRLSTAVRMSNDSIILTELDGTIVDVNHAGLKMYDADDKKDLIGKNSFDLLSSEKQKEASADTKTLMEQGYTPPREYSIVTKDGRKIVSESSTSVMKDTTGKPIGFVTISRDITDRKKTEEAIKEVNNLLQRSNKELESYTYVVSHDLKAPLRTVRSFGSFILEDYKDKLDETGQDYLNRMIRAASHMDQMIEDLLVLSRVGRKFTEIKKVDLNKLVDEILSDLEATIKETKTKVVVTKLPVLYAQKVWMRQLFMNLISNALKFNDSKSPKIEVLYEEKDGFHQFKVRDNGIGIEEKYLERIFKLFERAPTEKKYDGTGAGLSICKKIVEHYGGKIWVESTPGKGSTFMFTLPKKTKNVEKGE